MLMAEGRDRQMWVHTSWLLALIANVNRDAKKTLAFKPADFNPYAPRRRPGVRITKDNIRLLKSLLRNDRPQGKAGGRSRS